MNRKQQEVERLCRELARMSTGILPCKLQYSENVG
jgi:hypothetical protein